MSHNDSTDHPYEPPQIVSLGFVVDLTAGNLLNPEPDTNNLSAD